MGKKWFSAVQKILGIEDKEKRKTEKPMKKRSKSKDSKKSVSDIYEDSALDSSSLMSSFSAALPLKNAFNDEDNGPNHQDFLIATATVVTAEVVTPTAAVGKRLTISPSENFDDGNRKEIAAIRIQAVFRGFLERKKVGLRGMVRLKLMANRNAAKRQTLNTLHTMQTLARIQSQVRKRRIRLSEENQAIHRQRQLKREKELQKSKVGEDWVDSPKSKEQFEATLQKKQEAVQRRERTLAYAYSRQWRSKSVRPKNPSFIDQTNPRWGWSWLERWMATRPWETYPAIMDRDRPSDFTKCQTNSGGNPTSTKRHQVPSTPPSVASNDGMSSFVGFQSGKIRRRRHSIGGSFCFKDQEATKDKSHFQLSVSCKSRGINGGSLSLKQLPLTSKKTTASPVGTGHLSVPQKLAVVSA